MKIKLAAALAILLAHSAGVFAHRLDEYLQATIFSIEKDHVQATIRLIPGVAVAPTVLASIDTNRDGVISESEQSVYALQVLHDLSLTVDGKSARLTLVSQKFPAIDAIKQGLGEIQIEFTADLPNGGSNRTILFENHHQNAISVYLVNCLVPRDPDLRILSQIRNETQSFYQLVYAQAGSTFASASRQALSTIPARMSGVGFASIFRLGMRHIGEGTDQLLFLLTLLLPGPLLALGSRWTGFAGVRPSLLQILRVVTAFTIGHSITLALAALGFVHVPGRPIEVAIAVSILVSAIHAIRPLFPRREAALAAFFGLIHGLAFAAALRQLGFGHWERVAGILGFNLGIETMQLIVVAAVMPSLLLIRCTPAYRFLRIGGAVVAGCASAGWIAERSLNMHFSVDVIVNGVARQAVWIAGILFLISLGCWLLGNLRNREPTAVEPLLPATLKRI
jgi:HupE/UreJ protein